MSLLPDNWSMVPLGQVATLQRGFDLPVQAREPGQVPIFAANGPVGTHTDAKVAGPGVVTGRSGTLGQVHFVDSDFWPLNTALWVKDFHGNDPRWIFRLLAWMDLKQFTRGAGVPTLNRNLVHVVEVPIPPLAEQKRIAAILDAADGLRAKRRESLAQLDTLLQSTFLDMFGDPVTNPKGWDDTKLIDLCDLSRGISYGVVQRGDHVTDGIPLIRIRDILNGNVESEQLIRCSKKITSKYQRTVLRGGELVISIRGTVGRIARAPEILEGGNITRELALIPLHPEVIWEFVLELIKTDSVFRRLAEDVKGVAQKGINLRDLRELRVLQPPLDLQRRFATIVESVERQKARLRQHLAELDTLFASLQQRAFNGELEP